MRTVVMVCTCKNEQQDEIHGMGRRAFNQTAKKDPPEYRCTVCGSEKSKGGTAAFGKKKK